MVGIEQHHVESVATGSPNSSGPGPLSALRAPQETQGRGHGAQRAPTPGEARPQAACAARLPPAPPAPLPPGETPRSEPSSSGPRRPLSASSPVPPPAQLSICCEAGPAARGAGLGHPGGGGSFRSGSGRHGPAHAPPLAAARRARGRGTEPPPRGRPEAGQQPRPSDAGTVRKTSPEFAAASGWTL